MDAITNRTALRGWRMQPGVLIGWGVLPWLLGALVTEWLVAWERYTAVSVTLPLAVLTALPGLIRAIDDRLVAPTRQPPANRVIGHAASVVTLMVLIAASLPFLMPMPEGEAATQLLIANTGAAVFLLIWLWVLMTPLGILMTLLLLGHSAAFSRRMLVRSESHTDAFTNSITYSVWMTHLSLLMLLMGAAIFSPIASLIGMGLVATHMIVIITLVTNNLVHASRPSTPGQ